MMDSKSDIFSSHIKSISESNWNFISGLSGEPGQSGWKISQILWPFLLSLAAYIIKILSGIS